MEKDEASNKADLFLKLLIEHQPGFLGSVGASTQGGAAYAIALAAVRKTLIEELEKQPTT